MHDIENSDDVKLLIDSFYTRVREDDVIGYIFNDIAKVDWPKHLPRMYAFWEFLLLQKESYQGNPLEPHRRLHAMVPLTEAHFTRWLKLFTETVDSLFKGLRAEDAKNRAKLIAMTWQPKFTNPNML
jgi:hemoglobin